MSDMKKTLEQLCDIREEIKSLKSRIEKLEPKTHDIVSDSVESTTKIKPIILTNQKIRGLDQHKINQLEYYKTILETRHSKLLDIKIQVEKYIDEMPTSRLRRIFTMRYIDRLSWDKIALYMNASSSDSIRMEHDRYLKKNKVCSICSVNS